MSLLHPTHFRTVEDFTDVLENGEAQLTLEEVGAAKCDDLFDRITPASEGGLERKQGNASAKTFYRRLSRGRDQALLLIGCRVVWWRRDSEQLQGTLM